MKYVIIHPKGLPSDVAPKMPILFPDLVSHCDAVPNGFVAVSAGFFNIVEDFGLVACWGKSDSLKLISHPDADANLINAWIQYGEAILTVAGLNYPVSGE